VVASAAIDDQPPKAFDQVDAGKWWRPLLPWIVLAVLVRVALAPFTSYPFDMASWITEQDRLFNAGLNPLADWKFSVPLMGVLIATFMPSVATAAWLGVPLVIAQQLWIKMPFIGADIVIGFLLGHYVWTATHSEKSGRMAALVWLFSPVGLFFTAVQGQFDSLAAVLLFGAIVCAQAGRVGGALALLLLAGSAKYFGFVGLPVFAVWALHAERQRLSRIVRLGVAMGATILLAFPTIMVPWLRSDLFAGVSSSGLTNEGLGVWSVWAHGLLSADVVRYLWLALFGSIYVAILTWAARTSADRDARPHALLALLAGSLGVLVALDPVGNPQFLVWLMPLLLGVAFVARSSLILVISGTLACLNLVALWRSESPLVWWLHAVPDVYFLHLDFALPATFVDLQDARAAGSLYGIGLLFVALLSLAWGGRARPTSSRSQAQIILWRAAVALNIAAGAAVVGLFLALSYQPSLVARYSAAPSTPPEIEEHNNLLAARVEWEDATRERLVASWARRDERFLEGHLDRVMLEVVGSQTLSPAIERITPKGLSFISSPGLRERFIFRRPLAKVKISLLLKNEKYGKRGGPPLPRVVLYAEGGPSRPLAVRTSVETADNPPWFVVRVDQLKAEAAREYTLELSAPRSDGWAWAGGGDADGTVFGLIGQTKSSIAHWIQVWGIWPVVADPLTGETPGSPSRTNMYVTLDDRLAMDVRLDDTIDLNRLRVFLPAQLARMGNPSVSLGVDITSRAWWRSHLGIAIMYGLLSVIAVGLFAFTVHRISRWVWSESG
jgi:hypothetical protein